MEKVKTLVTGGAGFMGSHLSSHLLDQGHAVTILDDLSGGFQENIDRRAEFVEGSITDQQLVNSIISRRGIEYVYHLAAYAAEGLSHFIKKFNYENNLIGSINLINASINHGVKCFVFTSSIAVYGKNQLPLTEKMVPVPEDSYGIAKLAIEQELRVSHEVFGLNYVIFRPHNVYGERQNIGDRYRNVAGIFMNQLMKQQPMTIFGDGEQTRAFTYVGDVIPIIAQAPFNARAQSQIFNVGADVPYTVNELAEKVAAAMGVPLNVAYLDARNEVKHAFSDHERVREIFAYSALVPLEDGLTRMAAWARAVGAKQSRRFDQIEVMKNMPKSWLGEFLPDGLEIRR